MAHVVAIANHKGGVGKSTTAVNLAAGLALLHFRVLMIDLDPQGHSTIGLGIYSDKCLTVAEMIAENNFDPKDVIQKTNVENLDCIPADLSLAAADLKISCVPAKEFRLRRALDNISGYDYVIIDCAPSFGTLLVNALVAAKHVLLPLKLGFFSLEGVSSFMDTLSYINENVGSVINHQVDILGVLVTFKDLRTKISREIQAELNSIFGNKMFDVSIPCNVKLNEAQVQGQCIFHYAPGSTGSEAYKKLTLEFVERTKNVGC